MKKATIPGPKDSALSSVADFVIEQGDRIPEEARIQGGNPPEDRGTILQWEFQGPPVMGPPYHSHKNP